jgi:hypothetical protein
MSTKSEAALERVRSASREEIAILLYETDAKVLAALIENPQFDESHFCTLLERKDLPGELLEKIAGNKDWLRIYRIRRGLAFHVHAPRLVAMRLARELYLMDLVQLSLLPVAAPELRRLAEELILARLAQLPLGQKMMLARRATARVAGGLLAEGHPQAVAAALDNAYLTEAQVLKVLAREETRPAVVPAIAKHRKWSHASNVRLALLRHPKTPLDCVLEFLPDLTQQDLEEMARSSTLPTRLRQYLRGELARRGASGEAKHSRKSSKKDD